ncbi:MAG: metallophosphoesterase [Chlamydiota bacterium]
MKFWAFADLHLSLGVPEKSMEVFGWEGYIQKMAESWDHMVGEKDVVLLAGDHSWASDEEEARKDLSWIEERPGRKVLIKGNHDRWWSSRAKVEKILPPSLQVIQNDAVLIEGVAIGGARLWDSWEYSYEERIVFEKNEYAKEKIRDPAQDRRLFTRELGRLERSLLNLPQDADTKIAMTHYPPIGPDLAPSLVSNILEKYAVDICVFGHLHNVPPGSLPLGQARGVVYHLVAADYRAFSPLLVWDTCGENV